MVSREQQRRAALHEKLQLLRSVTNSHAANKKSIIVDASKYIEDLKEKVERLKREIVYARNIISGENKFNPVVKVETIEKGFLIKVHSQKNCPGLLVFILDVFEELGLNVLEASASCTQTFSLEAFGAEEVMETLDAEVVEQAVRRAISNCIEISPENCGE